MTSENFLASVEPGQTSKAEKLLQRLCRPQGDGLFEWKPELVTEDALVRKVGGNAAVREQELVRLWDRSRDLEKRTAYPHLAPVSNKSQLVSRCSFTAAPVFGIDVLVRPPAVFSEDRAEGETRNALTLGAESIALIVHAGFDQGRLDRDEEYFVRLVVGDDLAIPKVQAMVPPAAGRCELAMLNPLLDGDAPGAVAAALPQLERFASDVASAFVF